MPENVNTNPLADTVEETDPSDTRPVMVEVDHVSMIFNMANQQLNSLKEYAIALARRELMFKEFRALDDVSFTVRKGDVFGILGTNGSGKSTMMKIIAGVLEPSRGSCTVNGNIAPLIELGAGFDMELTARENIFLNGALLGYSKKFIQQHFDEIVEFAEIEKFLDMPMKNYSSGMVARIAFAIATVIVPDILIVDEVLSVGDFMFQQKCERRIMTLIKEHNVTVLIVSHNNDQIERLCNKAIWIEKGHTRMIGDAEDVCRTYRVLGGHVGSAEAEQRVFEMLNARVRVPGKLIDTISAESRYGTAAKLVEKCSFDKHGTAILAPGELASPCMATAGLSGLLDAPVLLAKPDGLPDITAQELKQLAPRRVVLVGSAGIMPESIVDQVREAVEGEVSFERVEGDHPADIAMGIYRLGLAEGERVEAAAAAAEGAPEEAGAKGTPDAPEDSARAEDGEDAPGAGKSAAHDAKQGASSPAEEDAPAAGWGDTAILTYDGCTGDLISFSPYSFRKHVPTFFIRENGVVGEETAEALASGAFKHVLVLGGEIHVPDTFLNGLADAGVDWQRVCGDGPFNANELINDLMTSDRAGSGGIAIDRLVVTSVWNPFDAFAAAAYAGKSHSAFLLEDTQDLDSVAHALDYVEKKHGAVKHLTFLGDDIRFGKLDKRILAKAVVLAGREEKKRLGKEAQERKHAEERERMQADGHEEAQAAAPTNGQECAQAALVEEQQS